MYTLSNIVPDISCAVHLVSVFLKRFIAHTVYTGCTRINYRIVPVNNLNKYLQYGTSGTE
jgi:hypothetical protein